MRKQAEEIVEAMYAIHGRHEGHRSVHAKGLCCKGTFTATPEAAALTTAAHMQGQPTPVTVRLSNGTGKPARADGAKDERGMAIKFHLEDGSTTDIVSLTLPVFYVTNPDDFLAFLQSQAPDPETGKPDANRVAAFVDAHPEAQLAFGFSMFTQPPASYANCTFHGIHAFGLVAPDGTKRWIRYRFVPEAGDTTLTDAETRELGREYLREEIESRLAEGEVKFNLQFQLGEPEDDPTNPTIPWPEERTFVDAGTLTLTDFAGDDCRDMIFDPGRVTEGIEPSDDLILKMRSEAYSVSYERRQPT